MSEDLKKIIILAIAIALGILLFRVIMVAVGTILALLIDVIIVALIVFGGIYVYKKYIANK